MNCLDLRERLERYLDGEVGGAERREVEEHLAACADCAAALEELRREAAQWSRALRRRTAPAAVQEAVMARVRQQAARRGPAPGPPLRGVEGRAWFGQRLRLAPALAAVTALAAVVLGGSWLWSLWRPMEKGRGLVAPAWAGELSPLEVQLLGQAEWLADSPASVRIVARNHPTEEPVANAAVTLQLKGGDPPHEATLLETKTNAQGTIDASFRVPNWPEGQYELTVRVASDLGTDVLVQPVTLRRDLQILLTTDKPVYQPEQKMHLRALALRRPDLQPLAQAEITLEVEDARGNKVFKKAQTASQFGIVAATFQLADEINFGDYRVRAVLGNHTAEKTVAVRKYVLPKFKLALKTDRDYYLPGETVQGRVQADYFFGQPVAGGEVKIVASTFDVGLSRFAEIKGRTDEHGTFEFEEKLPDHFVGLPLEQGKAFAQFDVTVTDGAEHQETLTHTTPIAPDHLSIVAIPESGEVVPKVENCFYLMTTYPDGTPAHTRLTIQEGDRTTARDTDELGLATYATTPEGRKLKFKVTARDSRGNEATKWFSFAYEPPDETLLLRTDKALAKVGDPLRVEVVSTIQRGTVYVDFVREGQTMLTRSLALEDGHGAATVTLDPALAGTVEVHAYKLQRDGSFVRDTRIVYVNSADDLAIAIQGRRKARAANEGADVYAPGEEAHLEFAVTDQAGKPVVSALGIQVVDESVFALQEIQPGLAKAYFTLAKELLEPKYEIHGVEPADLVAWSAEPHATSAAISHQPSTFDSRQTAAQVLFSAAAQAVDFSLTGNSYDEKLAKFREKWQPVVAEDARKVHDALNRYRQEQGQYPRPEQGLEPLLAQGMLTEEDLRDPWGQRYLVQPLGGSWPGVLLTSIGPDRQPGTDDDLVGQAVEPQMAYRLRRHVQRGGVFSVDGEARWMAEPAEGEATFEEERAMDALQPAPPLLQVAPAPAAGMGGGGGMMGGAGGGMGGMGGAGGGMGGMGGAGGGMGMMGGPGGRMVEGLRPDRAEVHPMARPVTMSLPSTPAPPPQEAQLLRTAYAPAKAGETRRKEEVVPTPARPPRVRQFFPETLFFEPALITDSHGRAALDIPLADSITTWRLTALASSLFGQLGSATHGLRVFQDFFIDLDLPVALTQGDEVSIPVAIHNYLPESQAVRVVLQTAEEEEAAPIRTSQPLTQMNVARSSGDWFDLLSPKEATLTVEPNSVQAVHFRLRARAIGKQRLTVHGYGTKMSDAISREIEVRPDGREVLATINDRLEGPVQKTVTLPPEAIPGTGTILVKIYPGVFSQVVEGLDSLLQMPYGCFEQTSSVTYPNVLVLDYLKKTKRTTPELEMKAEEYINLGYQRLLSFEVSGGGFSCFGEAPPNRVLTAYGLMELSDMAEVYEVDPALLSRTREWLLEQRNSAGTWDADSYYVHGEMWAPIENSRLLPTAYLTWALLESDDSASMKKSLQTPLNFIRQQVGQVDDPYALALCANALCAADPYDASTGRALDRLVAQGIETKETLHWETKVATFTYAYGASADLETTALAAQALLRGQRHPRAAEKALRYLIRAKDPHGRWGTTQATTQALKALLLSQERAAAGTEGEVRLRANGREAGVLPITPQDSDVVRQVNLREYVRPGDNRVEIDFDGEGGALYQIVHKYYVPWTSEPSAAAEPLDIQVRYDRAELSTHDLVTCEVTVRNRQKATAHMVLVDLGVPPGFTVQSEDLTALVEQGKIEKFHQTGCQVIVYLEKLTGGQTLRFAYRLKARMPLRAKTPQAQAYLYYNPEVRATARPTSLVVKGNGFSGDPWGTMGN